MNFRIVENPPDKFDEVYPEIKELLNTTNLTLCEILKRFDFQCNNNSMYRKITRTYAQEMGFNLKARSGRIRRGVWV